MKSCPGTQEENRRRNRQAADKKNSKNFLITECYHFSVKRKLMAGRHHRPGPAARTFLPLSSRGDAPVQGFCVSSLFIFPAPQSRQTDPQIPPAFAGVQNLYLKKDFPL